jgi:hypothetical protein
MAKYTEYRRVRERIEGDIDMAKARKLAASGDGPAAAMVGQLLAAVERGVKLGSLARSTRNKHYRQAQDAETRAGHAELRLQQIGRVVSDGLIYEDPNLTI